ncbi:MULTISPECIES: hypothetical protein [Methylobacterium]|jgi:hypothetical protein|uniref:Uncharacterized protein n=1 Tax=Methylobacterium isbiliense TaxID=315478 RepID=A0ABQ4SB34_9HYPH|nr:MULTISPECIES: hypothetical protein [Methylobacterium]MBY0299875.1 hypothetical protein [Methylobacterium sp.]MDN3626918.1 hypothetical protein [Methylobacterium isbiliense]GJD99362.1 hypothetical protein GMJLKIPL_1278 [Methylobacterium isbiliense]
MNDFVALLLAALAACLGFMGLGLIVRLAVQFDLGSRYLGEGSFLQVALALGIGLAAWRRATRTA